MLRLFLWAGCPYCNKVSKAAEDLGLVAGEDYEWVEAGPGTPGRRTVEQKGGKSMVPFLIDNEVSMYESDDIVSYLQGKCSSQ